MLISRSVIASGAILILAMTVGVIRFDPPILIGAITALIGGAVLFGSNRTTAAETNAALDAAEAERKELIGTIDLRLVSDTDRGR